MKFRCDHCGLENTVTQTALRQGLTRMERQLLDALGTFEEQHRYAPTYSQLAEAVGIKGKSGVWRIITNLRTKGYIAPSTVHKARAALTPIGEEAYERALKAA